MLISGLHLYPDFIPARHQFVVPAFVLALVFGLCFVSFSFVSFSTSLVFPLAPRNLAPHHYASLLLSCLMHPIPNSRCTPHGFSLPSFLFHLLSG